MVNIRREEKTTYTNVPGPYLEELEPIFKAQGYEYNILDSDHIPDGEDSYINLDGHICTFGVCCIESHMNVEDVHLLVLQIWHPDRFGELYPEKGANA